MSKKFLTAEWRHLAMLNYEVEPSILVRYLPVGTELDLWHGKVLVSVVGFRFLRTRVLGVPIPGHRDFDEVNLRFYVRRQVAGEWRRGVVFIKELVPRAAIAFVARQLYNEPYLAVPMAHRIEATGDRVQAVEYSWRFRGRRNYLKLRVQGPAQPLRVGSEAEFITEHYWGYNRQRNGSTLEYQVAHPRWQVYEVVEANLHCDVAGLYGDEFCAGLSGTPTSAFLAEGSGVSVYQGVPLTQLVTSQT